jgi:hypothetical protein
MTISRCSIALVVSLGLLSAHHARGGQSSAAVSNRASDAAAVPQLVQFSGALKNYDGKPASGVVGVTFLLYAEEEGGQSLWRETQNVPVDAEGRYSVALGAGTAYGLPSELFAAGQARWLAIEPQGLPAPARILLLSVPYAMKAGDAETLGGLPASAFLRAGSEPHADFASASGSGQSMGKSATAASTSGSGTVNYIPRWTPDGATLGNSILFQSGSGSTAKIGINKATPTVALDVNGSVAASGSMTANGGFVLSAKGTATAAKGSGSQPLSFQAAAFSSSTQKATAPKFQWQAETQGNNTAAPGASLNLLYSATATPTETGLKIAGNGQVTFAPGQTFPGAGTLSGITAGTGLTGGGTTGSPTLGIDSTKVPLLASANTFTAPITFASGQTFPGTGTLTGLTAGTGLTGGGTSGAPTIGIDATKVPLLASANTFTAPITFASSQSFPGTVTGVTAGTGLTGGGSGGAVTLKLDTNFSDARYAQSGANVIFGDVHSTGIIRAENGLSLGGNAVLSVDAPSIVGGHFVVFGDGRVGINKPLPGSALDVVGNIVASGSLSAASFNVSGSGIIGSVNVGSLQVNSDQPMTAAPHLYLTGYVPGPMAALFSEVPIISIPSKSVLVTRMVANGLSTCPQSGALTFDLATSNATLHTLTLTSSGSGVADSGPLSIPIAAGTTFWGRVNPPNCGAFGTAPSHIAVSIEYVMQ